MKLTQEQKQSIYDDYLVFQSKSVTAEHCGVHRSTVQRIVKEFDDVIVVEKTVELVETRNFDTDEIIGANVKLAKKVQGLQDLQRVERKSFREHARVDNMILELHQAMKDTLDKNRFTEFSVRPVPNESAPVGIIQLSDIHFNELVNDHMDNQFNFDIASKRLHKLIRKAKTLFLASGVKTVCLFMTGDLLNSDRRLDEITAAATNRSRAVFLAVDIIQQIIMDLHSEFDVTVASITGNESRVGEHIHYSDFLAGDSYDIVIHNMLTYLFKGWKTVTFLPVSNPLEQVVTIGKNNILLIHGHAHRGLARNPELEVEKIKARYAVRGTLISYALCGHIHSALISDLYARSSGLPGANAYSERGLNLVGRSSQNIYLVNPEVFGEIDGIKIDLQEVKDEPAYPYDETLESYSKKAKAGTVVIQSVLV